MLDRYDNNSVSLAATDLFCERDDRVLFESLSFAIGNGDLLQLAGPNGAGKTTLLRLLAGLNRDYDGELLWHDEPLDDVFSEYAARRLYLGHSAAIKRALTPIENLRWLVSPWAEQANISDDELWQALEQVELGGYEETPCNQLSAGQQRRVGLARLDVVPAPLWILDEPFTALDVYGVEWLEQRIQRHVERNGAVVITSHHALQNIPSLQRLDLGVLAASSSRSDAVTDAAEEGAS